MRSQCETCKLHATACWRSCGNCAGIRRAGAEWCVKAFMYFGPYVVVYCRAERMSHDSLMTWPADTAHATHTYKNKNKSGPVRLPRYTCTLELAINQASTVLLRLPRSTLPTPRHHQDVRSIAVTHTSAKKKSLLVLCHAPHMQLRAKVCTRTRTPQAQALYGPVAHFSTCRSKVQCTRSVHGLGLGGRGTLARLDCGACLTEGLHVVLVDLATQAALEWQTKQGR